MMAASTSPRPPVPTRPGEGAIALRDLPLDGEGALYQQIYRSIRSAILEGRVAPGTRLPTTRSLAQELGISRNTVVSAFEPLQAEGYVITRIGAGTFVAPQVGSSKPTRHEQVAVNLGPQASLPPIRLSVYGRNLNEQRPRALYDLDRRAARPRLDFRPCVPDLERLPYEDWRRHLARTAHHLTSEDFDYADPSGHESLRSEIAAYLGRARGIVCTAEDIVIVGGVAQALDLSTRLLLDAGDAALIEDPHYMGARRSFEAAGARLVGAPIDENGLNLASVPEADLAASRMAYVTPSHQFPTGSILSLSRRLELLEWAESANALVFEDDYDSEFRYAGRAIPSLKSLDEADRVLYVGTFSKTLIPSLRIAYLVAPRSFVDLFRAAKWMADWSAPVLEQVALARFLESGDFERHLRRARTLYAASRSALVEAIDRELAEFSPRYLDSQTGLHLLVRFPTIAASAGPVILRAARTQQIGLYPTSPCYLKPPTGPHGGCLEWVMGFARLDPKAIREGVSALRQVLAGRDEQVA